MAALNPSSIISAAAAASLLAPVKIRGYNTYTVGSNLISWDDSNSYTIEHVSATFGQSDSDVAPNQFKLGDGNICAFDYGLLFSCFAAIVAASVETGAAIPTSADDASDPAIHVVWFGCNAVIHSKQHNLIIPIKNVFVQEACKLSRVNIDNFVNSRNFKLSREGNTFVIVSRDNEFVCSFPIPLVVQRTYPSLFVSSMEKASDPFSGFDASWEEGSGLGALINNTRSSTTVEETLHQYDNEVSLANVIMRSDLIFEPTTRYSSIDEFLGSICYSDKGEISLAVNFRNQLFIYRPWFSGDMSNDLMVDSGPKFQNFFNVTEECSVIERFAGTVAARPLSPAAFDVGVFNRVRDAFFRLELPRLQLSSAFGRVVVPESVLVQGVKSAGESVYCMVPVGAIGDNIISLTPDGNLQVQAGVARTTENNFYDITEVAYAVS